MFTIGGVSCTVKGCCEHSSQFSKPEALHTPKTDIVYKGLVKEFIFALRLVPWGLGILLRDVVRYLIWGCANRPSWNFAIFFHIAFSQSIKRIFLGSSLSLWRVLSSSYARKSPELIANLKKASFRAVKLDLPGVLEDSDDHEDGTRDIEAHWIMPSKQCGNERVVLYLHGGGFCVKDWQGYLSHSQNLSKYTNSPVFCLTYRLSPETRYPGALVDTVQAYHHLIDHYYIKPENIVVVGDSAGANLALNLLIYLRDHGYAQPNACVMISPWLDLTYSHASWVHAAALDVLPPRPLVDAIMNPTRFYLGPSHLENLGRHPYVSPLFHENFDHLPPILVQFGGAEIMTDEILTWKKIMSTCEHTVYRFEEYEDMIHDFSAYPLPISTVAYKHLQTWVNADVYNKKQMENNVIIQQIRHSLGKGV